MKLFKLFQYAYIVFAVLFVYDAFAEYNSTGQVKYLSLFLAALSVFMFFFRKKFNNKFDNNK